jgi:hypothetical protein
MTPLLANIPDAVLVLISIPIVGGVLIAITAILADTYRKLQRDDMAATLKMEMIQRGMPADEIERILAARLNPPPPRKSRRDWQWWPEHHRSRQQ